MSLIEFQVNTPQSIQTLHAASLAEAADVMRARLQADPAAAVTGRTVTVRHKQNKGLDSVYVNIVKRTGTVVTGCIIMSAEDARTWEQRWAASR